MPNNIESCFNSEEKESKSIQVLKRSSIAEHLVNHPTCTDSYNRDIFKTIKNCKNCLI